MEDYMRRIAYLLIALLLIVTFIPVARPIMAADSDLPVPREQTLVIESEADTYIATDAFNTRAYLLFEAGSGYTSIGVEYLFVANLATGKVIPWLADSYSYNDDFTEVT